MVPKFTHRSAGRVVFAFSCCVPVGYASGYWANQLFESQPGLGVVLISLLKLGAAMCGFTAYQQHTRQPDDYLRITFWWIAVMLGFTSAFYFTTENPIAFALPFDWAIGLLMGYMGREKNQSDAS